MRSVQYSRHTMASSQYGRKLNPHHRLRDPLRVKGVRQSVVITNNPSTIDQNQQLLVWFPNLGAHDVIVPGTARLAFTITLHHTTDANRSVVQNLGRAVVKKTVIKINGNEVMSVDDSDVYYCYNDLWKTAQEPANSQYQSIDTSMDRNATKRWIGAGDASADNATDNAISAACGNRYYIPLDFELLESHMLFYQSALSDHLEYELTFNDYSRVITATDDATVRYTIDNIGLEYDMVTQPELARMIRGQHAGRLAILYNRVLRHRKIVANKSDTLWNINLNVPARSMKGILLLFEAPAVAFARNTEAFYIPKITKVELTIEGVPNQLYSQGMRSYQFWDEFLNSKYALWLDLRTTDDDQLHGSGRRIENASAGVTIQITKTAEDASALNIYLRDDTLPKDLHTAIICGQTGCGKMVFILDLLAGPYRGIFKHIVILYPTAHQSIWVLTQKYNSVLKDLREQTQWVAFFHCKDCNSFEDCLRENDVIPTREERATVHQRLAEVARLIRLDRTNSEMECDDLIDMLLTETADAGPTERVVETASTGQETASTEQAARVGVGHKREKLAALAAGGQTRQYLGKPFTIDQIDAMGDEEVEKLYARYEVRLGAAMTKTPGQAALQLYAVVAGMVLPIPPENQPKLVVDLEANPLVWHALSSATCVLYHRYGMYLAPLTAALTTANGSNYLFSMLQSSEADAERERHDKGIEQLQAAQAEWFRKRTERLDWINEELRRQGHVTQTFRDVDIAIHEYALATGKTLDPLGLMDCLPGVPLIYEELDIMMAHPREDLLMDIWLAMWDVQTCVRRNSVPGPLRNFGKIARRNFDAWFYTPGTLQKFVASKLAQIYYSPKGYWKGISAIRKLAVTAKVHQTDLLFLTHEHLPCGCKTCKYALTVVDVASRYKEVEPLATKEASEVADALKRVYKRGPLRWPKLLQVDPGCEFMGAVSQLFGHQHAQEMRLPEGRRSTEWVALLPAVATALNDEVTRLTGKKPSDAIKAKVVAQKFSLPANHAVGLAEQKLLTGVGVRYLYLPGPEHFDVACHIMVLLARFELQDVVNLEVKPWKSLGLVLALIGYELFLDGLAELLLGGLSGLSTLHWWTGHPFELAHVLDPRDSEQLLCFIPDLLAADDDVGDELLAHSVWCPLVLTTSSEEAVMGHEARLYKESQERCGSPALLLKVLPKPSGDHGVDSRSELPLCYFGEERDWCRLPAVALSGNDAGRMVNPKGPFGQCFISPSLAGRLDSCVGLLRPVDVALVYADLPTLGEVEVFGPGVAVVDDELNIRTTRLVFATVVDVCTGDVFQDDRPPKDLLKLSHIICRGARVMDPLFPLLDFLLNTIGNLYVANIKWVFCLYSPCRIDHSSAVDFKLIFGVIQDLNPWFVGYLNRGRSLDVQVNKLPLSFGLHLPLGNKLLDIFVHRRHIA
eukprot:g47112.t1